MGLKYRVPLLSLFLVGPASLIALAGRDAAKPADAPPSVASTAFPEFPTLTPKQPPVTPLPPDAAALLPADGTLYVAHFTAKVSADAFPAGVLKVTVTQTGADGATIFAKFIDSDGKFVGRTYKGPYIVTVVPEEKPTGAEATLVVVKAAKPERSAWETRLIRTGVAPLPPPKPPEPPGPTPVPPPTPVVDPAPIAGDGFKVLIVYDKDAVLTEGQHTILYGIDTRKLLDAKCSPSPDGKTKSYKIWGGKEDASKELKPFADAHARVKGKVGGGVNGWLLISNGKTGYDGPLPANETEFIALLNKY